MFEVDRPQVFDQQLRCAICFEFYNDCMMTKCSHNFCSFCLRNYLNYADFCPVCHQTISESDLRNNRQIDCLVKCFRDLRFKLVEMNIKSKNCFTDGKRDNETISLSDNDEDEGKEPKKASCPICSLVISEKNMKLHTDNCRKIRDRNYDDISKESPPHTSQKRPYLRKKFYKFLKEKDVREELRKYGLNTKGNKEVLCKRHKQFVILYNSDCDSENPRPVSELVKEIEASEQRLKYECERVKASEVKMTVNRNSCLGDIEKQRSEYLRFHQEQFSNLLHGIKTKSLDVEPSSSSKGVDSTKCRSATSSVSCVTRSKSKVLSTATNCTPHLHEVKLVSSESSNTNEELNDFTISKRSKRNEPNSRTTRLKLDT